MAHIACAADLGSNLKYRVMVNGVRFADLQIYIIQFYYFSITTLLRDILQKLLIVSGTFFNALNKREYFV